MFNEHTTHRLFLDNGTPRVERVTWHKQPDGVTLGAEVPELGGGIYFALSIESGAAEFGTTTGRAAVLDEWGEEIEPEVPGGHELTLDAVYDAPLREGVEVVDWDTWRAAKAADIEARAEFIAAEGETERVPSGPPPRLVTRHG